MNKKKIIVGARGSKLAIKYAQIAIREIKKFYNGKIELKKIVTKGDRILNRRTSDIGGKGEFVKNIEKELISKKIDIAVHSLKDIPYKETPGLIIKTFLKRNSPKEVLISKNNLTFEKLKKNSIIGTSSFRREFQLKTMRSDLKFKLIRGNIDSRIKKIYEKKYDAIILAKAGLKCLKMTNLITQEFNCNKIIPSAGQGIISLQARKNDHKINIILKSFLHYFPNKHTLNLEYYSLKTLKMINLNFLYVLRNNLSIFQLCTLRKLVPCLKGMIQLHHLHKVLCCLLKINSAAQALSNF